MGKKRLGELLGSLGPMTPQPSEQPQTIEAEAAAPDPVASPEGATDALAQAMADSGYADPDPTDQWVLPDAAVIVRRLRERGYTVDPVASPPGVEALLRDALTELLASLEAPTLAWVSGTDVGRIREAQEQARAALAAPTEPVGLDVSRLTEAIAIHAGNMAKPGRHDCWSGCGALIAAEYARLDQPVAEEGENGPLS